MQVLAESSLYVSDADQDLRGWLNPKGFNQRVVLDATQPGVADATQRDQAKRLIVRRNHSTPKAKILANNFMNQNHSLEFYHFSLIFIASAMHE